MKTLRFAAAVAALMAAGVAGAAPVANFGTGASTQIFQAGAGSAHGFVRAAFSPDGSKFALFFAEDTNLVLQIRTTATEALVGSALVLNAATTGWADDGEFGLTFNPAGTEVIAGWGVGSDAGVAAQRVDATTGAAIGSVVTISAGFGNKPKFDWFSDGSLLVAYEGIDGVGNLGGAVMRRYAADLTAPGTEIILHDASNANPQGDPAISIIRSGTFATDVILTAWEDSGNSRFPASAPGTDDDVNYRFFDSSFNALNTLTGVPATNLLATSDPLESAKIGNPAIGLANDGSFVIAWEGEVLPSTNERVLGAFFDTGRAPLATTATAISTTGLAGRQQGITLKFHTASDHYVAYWMSRGGNTAQVRFFTKAGVAAGAEVTVNADQTPASVRYGNLDLNGNQAIATWADASADDIYYRLFTITDNTAVSEWELY